MKLGRGGVLAAAFAVALLACGEEPSSPDAGVGPRDAGGGGGGVVVECDPPCADDEFCDRKQTPPACMPVCNPPFGCLVGSQRCNVETKRCEPVSCDGEVCESGQRCVNLETGGDEAPVVCTCLPRRPNPEEGGAPLEDTCAAIGMVCERGEDEEVPRVGRCVKPGARERCLPSVGCRDDLECVSFGGVSHCTRSCSEPADCLDPRDTCRADLGNKCWVNPCAINDRSQYFQSCRAVAGDDGTCVPVNAGNTDTGACTLFGTAAPGGACDPDADRSEPGMLCPLAHVCVPLDSDPLRPSRRRGVCLKMCNAAPATSANPLVLCGPGEVCENFAGDPREREARLGVCRPSCDLLGDGACPTGPLGGEQSCQPLEGTDVTTGVCRPQRPEAGEREGDGCAPAANGDARERCGSGLGCAPAPLPAAGTCSAWCDVTLCSDPEASCAACSASAARCTPLSSAPSASAGLCQP